eukprot:6484557-Amphidinium_carterae.1
MNGVAYVVVGRRLNKAFAKFGTTQKHAQLLQGVSRLYLPDLCYKIRYRHRRGSTSAAAQIRYKPTLTSGRIPTTATNSRLLPSLQPPAPQHEGAWGARRLAKSNTGLSPTSAAAPPGRDEPERRNTCFAFGL